MMWRGESEISWDNEEMWLGNEEKRSRNQSKWGQEVASALSNVQERHKKSMKKLQSVGVASLKTRAWRDITIIHTFIPIPGCVTSNNSARFPDALCPSLGVSVFSKQSRGSKSHTNSSYLTLFQYNVLHKDKIGLTEMFLQFDLSSLNVTFKFDHPNPAPITNLWLIFHHRMSQKIWSHIHPCAKWSSIH